MFQGMEYVYEIYKEKSFSKAAKKLYISQPSLSATVKRIETKIGYPLFDRSKKPLELTECGKKYIQAVEQLKAVHEEFRDFINDWGDLKVGELSVGSGSMFMSWVLPPIIETFAHQFPSIKIELVEESVLELEELLKTGKIDFMVDNSTLDHDIYDRKVIHKENLILVVPKKFKVNDKLKEYQLSVESIQDGSYLSEEQKAVPLKEFGDEPFILLKNENDTRERAKNICRENEFIPNIMFELDQQSTAYNISCSGVGISFISDTLISKLPSPNEVVYYKLKGEQAHRDVYIYWKKGRYMTRAMEEFFKMTMKGKCDV